jgi:hypothetical protein
MSFSDAIQLTRILLAAVASVSCSSSAVPNRPPLPPVVAALVDSAPTVSFCELVKHPELYQQKVIRIQAILHGDRENQMLYDSDCPDEDSFSWVVFDPAYANTDESIKIGLAEALRPKPPNMEGKARVTAVGRFEGPNSNGFGHLNGYRFQFSIMRIEQANEMATIVERP